ncbi:hypothetical protein [Plastoroseomonas hellenica]|uniref:hypothetical protein n=1 Tax=Plastoroseomonas hellenica TaxID=2687306 RepID=UPI001BABDCFE|nr:hypothetical protein [Plastoroseomonas hellenica]MBR0646626.1 hypothetical protein [Plastoroseomonas hellenica]
MRIRKVVTPVDAAVTLRVWIDDDGRQVGEVFAPSEAIPGTVLKITAPEPIDARKAAAAAVQIATRRGLELAVADLDDLWDGIPFASA